MTERCSRASSHYLGEVQGNRSQRISKGVLAFCRGFYTGPLIRIIASRLCRFGRLCCCITHQASSLVVAAGLPSRRVRIRRCISSQILTTGITTFGARRQASAAETFPEKGFRCHTGGPRGPLKQKARQRGGWMGWCRLPGAGAGCNLQTPQTSICALTLELLCAHASHMAYYAGRTHLKSTSYVLQNFSLHHIGIFHLDV